MKKIHSVLVFLLTSTLLFGCIPPSEPEPENLESTPPPEEGGNGGGTTGGSSGTDVTIPTTSISTPSATIGKVRLAGVVSTFSSPSNKSTTTHSSGVSSSAFSVDPFSNATVTLYKRTRDGNRTKVGSSVQTSADGSYSFSEVDQAVGGNGDTSDFFYEIEASDGTNTVSTPIAPASDNSNVDINPETHIATKLLTEVVDNPNASDVPLPSIEAIEQTRDMVANNMNRIRDSINVASTTAANSSKHTEMANGLAAAGGNSELVYKTYQFESEFVELTTNNQVTDDQVTGYMKRVARQACGEQSDNAMSKTAALALGKKLRSGTTYTVNEVITQYNANSSQAALDSTQVIDKFTDLLKQIESNFHYASSANSTQTEAVTFGDNHKMGLFIKRGLKSENFSGSTELSADQAWAFLQYVVADGRSSQFCTISMEDVNETFSDLTGDTSLSAASIADVQIYNDSGFGCDQNNGEGHFRAAVDVYAPGTTVTSVTISSSDSNALKSGSVMLTENGGRYVSAENGVCVSLNTAVTYTVTANLASGNTVTETVSRNHPLVPEATASYNGAPMGSDQTGVTKVTEKRPTCTWGAPDTVLASITNAPANSRVKYTYEFSYIDSSVQQQSPLSKCESIPSGPMHEVDNFMLSKDCDPQACSTASGIAVANLQCRLNVQTYLVDDSDRLLGQAAGQFRFFCVDENKDGACGD